MAGQVVVKDVAALDRFAGQLKKSRTDLEQIARNLNSALSTVSSSWQDPQREKCAQEIGAIVRAMRGFAQAAETQVSYCQRLAAQIRSMP